MLITLLSITGIIAMFDYVTIEQQCKNKKKGFGKDDFMEMVSNGQFDKFFKK